MEQIILETISKYKVTSRNWHEFEKVSSYLIAFWPIGGWAREGWARLLTHPESILWALVALTSSTGSLQPHTFHLSPRNFFSFLSCVEGIYLSIAVGWYPRIGPSLLLWPGSFILGVWAVDWFLGLMLNLPHYHKLSLLSGHRVAPGHNLWVCSAHIFRGWHPSW